MWSLITLVLTEKQRRRRTVCFVEGMSCLCHWRSVPFAVPWHRLEQYLCIK